MEQTTTDNACPSCGEYEMDNLVFHGQYGDQIECQTCGYDYEAAFLPWANLNGESDAGVTEPRTLDWDGEGDVVFVGSREMIFAAVKHHVPDGRYQIGGSDLTLDCLRIDGIVGPDSGGVAAGIGRA